MSESDALIERWCSREEDQYFERKSALKRPGGGRRSRRPAAAIAKDVVEALAAMANADGGELVVGIEDDGEITGVPHAEDKVARIVAAPGDRQQVSPPLRPRVTRVSTANGLLLHFEVDWSPRVHQLADGRYVCRFADQSLPRSADDIAAIKEARQRRPAEGRIVSTASMDDIDRERLAVFRQRTAHSGTVEDLLIRYRLAEPRNGGVAIKLGALLLFGRDPARWHPRCGVDFVKYEGTERGLGTRLNIVHRRRIETTLPELIDETFAAIKPHVRERQRLVDLFFEERLEYPTFAWQEAIVNAVAHRDYAIEGVGIEIFMFDDRLEIRSPGGPIEPVTLDRLRSQERVHASRNPWIARVLTELGLMRELGEGIPRMYEEMGRAGLYPPDLALEGESFFTVTLRNAPIFSAETERWLAEFEPQGLTVDQKRLLAYAREHDGRFTSRAYQDLVGTDITGAQRDIRLLIAKGLVRRTAKHGKVYQLAVDTAVEAAVDLPDSLRPLVGQLRDDGQISNADVRKLLGVNRKQAHSLLKQWHDSGWLEKSGTRRWTRYSAGPRLSL